MNHAMIRYMLFWVLGIEGAILLLPCLIALIYQEREGFVYLVCALICLALGFALTRKRPDNTEIYTKDGMVIVAASWVVISAVGAVPFVVTREIPHYIDALFEIVSGFTTTGASILSDVEALSHASLLWRSFSHWIGGMGVLVFLLLLIPVRSGSQMNLMRAESPGYNVSKFVPRVRGTAVILYKIYIAMTIAEIAILLITRMYWFDAVCISFGTAGTGGFAVLNSGCASYTPLQQYIIAIFMLLFGVNFSFYFLLTVKRVRSALKMEEVRAYFFIVAVSVAMITVNLVRVANVTKGAFRDALFQVSSIITTTGFSTTDFNQWPSLAKYILIMLMCIGACAGSTGGGIKVSRIVILLKSNLRSLGDFIHPHSVKRVHMDGEVVDEKQVRSIQLFLSVYVLLFAASIFIVSRDGFGFETNFTSVAATINNIGPGLSDVGPMSNYSCFGFLSKVVLIFDMLAGRLEIFPLLILCYPGTWRSR